MTDLNLIYSVNNIFLSQERQRYKLFTKKSKENRFV